MMEVSGATPGEVPEKWLPHIENYYDALESGRSPLLSRCLDGFEEPPQAIIAEMLATHQSFCRRTGRNWPVAFQELRKANSRWLPLLAEASVLSARQSVAREAPNSVPKRRELGRYALIRPIAKGGFGAVYWAVDTKSGVWVIAKTPNPELGALAVEALSQERDALITLRTLTSNESLSRYIDWEYDESGTPALILEFEEATVLSKTTDRDARQILAWMGQLCEAVRAVHAAQVYHCDLKPQNVLIRNENGRAVLIDFGMAQHLLRFSREERAPTPLGGSLDYLAPELIDAETEADPEKVDVFGLGAVLYYLMTGQAPFRSSNPQKAEAKLRDYQGDLPLLEDAPYPADLKKICRRAMAPAPDERFASATAMGLHLKQTKLHRQAARRAAIWQAVRRPRVAIYLGAVALAIVGFWMLHLAGVLATSHSLATANRAAPRELPEWAQMAAEQGVDLTAIAEADFRVTVRSGKRGTVPWAIRQPTAYRTANLRVATEPRLLDIAAALQYRIGKRSWQPVSFDDDRGDYYGVLSSRDVEADSPIELRLGGTSDWDGRYVVGPYHYKLSVKDLIAHDEQILLKDHIAAATRAEWFDETQAGWVMRYDFSANHGPVIKRFRFGRTRDTLNLVAQAGGKSGKRGFATAYPLHGTMSLSESFAAAAKGVQDAKVLWRQIDFIDGSTTEPIAFKRFNRFGHDGGVASAEQMIAQMRQASQGPIAMGQFSGCLFRLDGLARVAGALQQVEYGESPDNLTHVYAVQEETHGRDLGLTYTPSADQRPASRLSGGLFQPGLAAERSIRVYDGALLAPTMAPPCWSAIYFRGRFTDETATAIYRADNTKPFPGFEAELVRVVSGQIEAPLFVFAYPKFGKREAPQEFDSALAKHFLPPNSPIVTEMFVPTPPSITRVRYFRDSRRREELREPITGTLFASFHGKETTRIGVCEYRIAPEKLAQLSGDEATNEASDLRRLE